VLALTPEKPLFGHISGKRQQTHWVCFLKQNQQAMGHANLETTMGYMHAEALSVQSPLEAICT
jgi:hypothetical protein